MSDGGTQQPSDPQQGARNLFTLFGLGRADQGQGMAWAAVDNFIRQSKDNLYAQKWHRAQVNAKLQQRYKACGDDEVYQPPPETDPEDDVGSTFMNNTIISDRAASVLSDALKGDLNVEQPAPQYPPFNPWRWILGTLLAVMLGAILILLAWNAFGKQPRYEIIAEPFEPPELLEFRR